MQDDHSWRQGTDDGRRAAGCTDISAQDLWKRYPQDRDEQELPQYC